MIQDLNNVTNLGVYRDKRIADHFLKPVGPRLMCQMTDCNSVLFNWQPDPLVLMLFRTIQHNT